MSDPTAKKRGKKKKPEAVFVDVRYPAWLGVASFAWAMLGWALAAAAPRLAFLPGVGLLHYLFPAVTAGLIAANLAFALRDLWRGAHVLRLLVVTGLQVCLFTTLFFQLFAHLGAELYDTDGTPAAWHWVGFSLAHALRAGDVLDVVEAYSMKIQAVKHTSALVALVVIAYHAVVDVFFLGVLWAVVERVKRRLLKDEGISTMTYTSLGVGFSLWLVVWVAVAFWFYPWNTIDIPLWFLENVLRVADFADVMESFQIKLHSLPREGLTGTLTFFCRVWIGVGIALVIGGGKKKKGATLPVATPPDAAPVPFWGLRAGLLFGMVTALLVAGVVWQLALGNPAPALAAAVAAGPEPRANAALAALRRMGPGAAGVIPQLVEARGKVSPATRDALTRTLGYLGPQALDPLLAVARSEPWPASGAAVEGLGNVGDEAAPQLLRVWAAADEQTKAAAAATLKRLGTDAVPPLMAAATPADAAACLYWFNELDRSWRLRGTSNPTVLALQQRDDTLKRLDALAAAEKRDAEEAKAVLTGLTACGTAATGAAPKVLVLLRDQTPGSGVARGIRADAEAALAAFGPAVTPMLEEAFAGPDGASPAADHLATLLSRDTMWDEAALKAPKALPCLVKLVARPEARPLAVHHLKAFGPAAKEAEPKLFEYLADLTPEFRKSLRATLAAIDPDWKTNPARNAAIPKLLLKLPALPKDEGDELFAIMGEMPASAADALVEAVRGPLNADFTHGTRSADERKRFVEKVRAAEVALSRWGPKIEAGVPALRAWLENKQAGWAHSEARDRLLEVVKAVALSGNGVAAQAERALRNGKPDAALAALTNAGPKDGTRVVRELLTSGDAQRRAVGVKAATAYGPAGAELADDLLKLLRGEAAAVGFGDAAPAAGDAVDFETVARALNAVDPAWAKRPGAGPAVANAVNRAGSSVESRRQALAAVAKLGPAAKPLAGGLAVGLAAGVGLDADARAALDRLDPDWQANAELRDHVRRLIDDTRLFGDLSRADARDLRRLDPLVHCGPVAAAELVERVKAVKGGRGWEEKTKYLQILKRIGPDAKPAVPALLRAVADADGSPFSLDPALAALDAIHPDWRTDPALKDDRVAAVAALGKRVADVKGGEQRFGKFADPSELTYATFAARFGPDAVPEMVKGLGHENAFVRHQWLAGLAKAGPAAKDAVPALTKLLKDASQPVRRDTPRVLAAVAGKDAGVLPLIAPGVLDPDREVSDAARAGLYLVDPEWAKSPQLKPFLPTAVKALADKNIQVRSAALQYVAECAGPGDAGVLAALQRHAKDEEEYNLRLRFMDVARQFEQRQAEAKKDAPARKPPAKTR